MEQRLAHRIPPDRPVVMHQTWQQMLFLHWRVDPAEIQKSLPEGLTVDTFEGNAWIGITPFLMRGARMHLMPRIPGMSDFLEVNVRTYVYDKHGRTGVWFFSLDCNQALAVMAARSTLNLPYRPATMSSSVGGDGFTCFQSRRDDDGHNSRFRYRLHNDTKAAEAGTLEFFLIERYLLFTKTALGLARVQVNHVPYPLAKVNLLEWDARLLELAGFRPKVQAPEHVIGSPGVAVKVFAPNAF
jgi:uncharacterized protein YqjF (DUF2071 family)